MFYFFSFLCFVSHVRVPEIKYFISVLFHMCGWLNWRRSQLLARLFLVHGNKATEDENKNNANVGFGSLALGVEQKKGCT
jgi:hypothetical protein